MLSLAKVLILKFNHVQESGVADNIEKCDFPLCDSYQNGENITLSCKSDTTMMATTQCNNGSWTTFCLNCPTGCVLKTNWKTQYNICDNFNIATGSGVADIIEKCDGPLCDSYQNGENITLSCMSDTTMMATSQCNNGIWTTFCLNCRKDSDSCAIPTYMTDITVMQGSKVLEGGMTINHTETTLLYCINGKEPYGREFKCDGGAWIAQDNDNNLAFEKNGAFPQCRNATIELSCPDLGALCNGWINYYKKGADLPVAYYKCNANTDLFLNSKLVENDNGVRKCQMNEQWSGPSELECFRRSTDNKANSHCKLCRDSKCRQRVKRKNIFQHGSEIYSRSMSKKYEMFRDEDGYLETDVIKHKQIDGQWEKPFPICIGARCDIIRNWNVTISYTNGSATGPKVPSSSDVIVACKLDTSKHELRRFYRCEKNDDGTATCTCNRGVLRVPRCKPKKCQNKDLPNILNSQATKRNLSQSINYLYASKHSAKTCLRCYDNHEVWDSVTQTYIDVTGVNVTCDFGKWIPNSDSLACVPKRCNVNDAIPNILSHVWIMTRYGLYLSLEDDMVENGILVYMNCTDGYDLKNNDEETISMANGSCIMGTLSLPFTCQPKSCEIPDVNHGRIMYLTDNQQYVKHNEQLTIKCDPKYQIFNNDGQVGNELIATCDKGNWNEKEIICEPNSCKGKIGQLKNGNIIFMRKGTRKERRRYSCNAGYVMNVRGERIWFMCIERNDVWFWRSSMYSVLSIADVKCQKRKECPAPPYIENMEYNILQRYRIKHSNSQPIQGYFTGDMYEYKCKEGYNQVSSTSNAVATTTDDYYSYTDVTERSPVTCSSDGTWNHTMTDKCVAITCDATRFVNISNGHIINYKDTYTYEEYLTLSCDPMYQPIDGNDFFFCKIDSSFELQKYFGCEERRCPPPSRPIHGNINYTSTVIGSIVMFSCANGYTLRGKQQWTCQDNEQWDEYCVICEDEVKDGYCRPPCVPMGATWKTDHAQFGHGSVIQFECQQQDGLYTDTINRRCMRNKHWSDQNIDCIGQKYSTNVTMNLKAALSTIPSTEDEIKTYDFDLRSINVPHDGVDVYILVDISSCINDKKYKDMMAFTNQLLPYLRIGFGPFDTRLALYYFASEVHEIFDCHTDIDMHFETCRQFKNYTEVQSKIDEADRNTYAHIFTGTGKALAAALKRVRTAIQTNMLCQYGSCSNVKQVIILLSDGKDDSGGDAMEIAYDLKSYPYNAEIFSIAIGKDDKGFKTMKNIASDIENEKHFFVIKSDPGDLTKVTDQMISDL